MHTTRTLPIAAAVAILAGCTTSLPTHVPEKDLGIAWVRHAAEYEAITRQTYRTAESHLSRMVEDESWSALPGQVGAGHLPPAVILDIDETVVNNSEFQVAFERPFADRKLEMWDREHMAEPVPGVVEFVAAARAAGVTVFFLTNRPCEQYEGEDDACPQKQTVINDIRELGIDVDPEFVSLSFEQPEWTKEKLTRRELIGKDYRVIMLIGDDLGDFVPCVRKSVHAPCTKPGTRASRAAAIEAYARFWGNGWYILPGPMHGSWSSVR